MKKVITGCLLASVFIFSSCEKSDEDSGPLTKMDMLTNSEWQFAGHTEIYYVDGQWWDAPNDVFANLDSCGRDFTLNFKKDGDLIQDWPCLFDEVKVSNWSFNSDETELIFEEQGIILPVHHLDSLSENTLMLSEEIDLGWQDYKVLYHYKYTAVE